jgi:hypothetical protein
MDQREDRKMNKLMWWGYLHSNGTTQLKRWYGDGKDYTDACYGHPFVVRIIKPFEAVSEQRAMDILKERLSE